MQLYIVVKVTNSSNTVPSILHAQVLSNGAQAQLETFAPEARRLPPSPQPTATQNKSTPRPTPKTAAKTAVRHSARQQNLVRPLLLSVSVRVPVRVVSVPRPRRASLRERRTPVREVCQCARRTLHRLSRHRSGERRASSREMKRRRPPPCQQTSHALTR
jgi:hypothetical protein